MLDLREMSVTSSLKTFVLLLIIQQYFSGIPGSGLEVKAKRDSASRSLLSKAATKLLSTVNSTLLFAHDFFVVV